MDTIDNEGSRVLIRIVPEGDQIAIDVPFAKELLFGALKSTLSFLNGTSVGQIYKEIWICHKGPINPSYYLFPNYFSSVINEKLFEATKLENSQKFLDYLWTNNYVKFHIPYNLEEPDTQLRYKWEYSIWSQLVSSRLLDSLVESRVADIVDGKEIKDIFEIDLWFVADTSLRIVADNVIEEMVDKNRGKKSITALCWLKNLTLGSTQNEFQLSDRIKLKKLTHRELSILLSRYDKKLHPEDDMAFDWYFENPLVEIQMDIAQERDYIVTKPVDFSYLSQIEKTLDLIKWAMLVSQEEYEVLKESDWLILDRFRTGYVARGRGKYDSNKFFLPEVKLDENGIEKCRVLLHKYGNLLSHVNFNSGVWLFGRSCTDNLGRDILLNAVFGIDSLVTNQKDGSYAYKFSLHSATLLARKYTRIYDYKFFQKLYDVRSAGAHKGKNNADYQNAVKARKALALIILAILELIPDETSLQGINDISEFVEQHIKYICLGQKNTIRYKGYIGTIEYEDAAGIFYGEVINLRDVITFQGTSVEELRQALQGSIDDYLEFCAKRDEQPVKPTNP